MGGLSLGSGISGSGLNIGSGLNLGAGLEASLGGDLSLNFQAEALDPRMTFTRATVGSRVNSSGLIEQLSSGAARFDYHPTTHAHLGILIEPATTNLHLRSEDFSNATWQKEGNMTMTADQLASPDGTVNADLYTNTGNNRATLQVLTTLTPENRTYWWSVFVKLGTLTRFTLGMRRGDASDATNNTSLTPATAETASLKIKDYGGGWYRYSMKKTFSASTTGDDAHCRIGADFGDTGTMYIWGSQLEEAVVPTSYIKTVASTVTRNAEVLQITGINTAPWFNASEGVLSVTGDVNTNLQTDSFPEIAALIAATDTTNMIDMAYNKGSATTRARSVAAGVTTASIGVGTVAVGTAFKYAFGYKLDNFNACFNGTLGSADISGAIPTGLTVLDLGQVAGATQLCGHIKSVEYYKGRQTDAFMQTLTT